MKKRFIVAALMLSLGFGANVWASQSAAPDRVGHWDLGLGISAAFNDEVDDAPYVSGSVSYGVTPYIGLGVEAGWQEADGNDDETIGAVPVLFDIIIRVPTVHDSIVPYGVLGLGGIGVYANEENRDDVDDTSFGWKIGGGLDYFINERWIFNFEFAYLSTDTSLPSTSVGDDFAFWTIGIALKYVF